jgi:hypothetical protein
MTDEATRLKSRIAELEMMLAKLERSHQVCDQLDKSHQTRMRKSRKAF